MGSVEKFDEQYRGVAINAKFVSIKRSIIVLTALYGAEAWDMRSAERRRGECSGDEVFEKF